MSKFLTELNAKLKDDDCVWVLLSPLRYKSDLVGEEEAQAGFETDFASCPRWIPIASNALLGKAHRESVIHDLNYRIDSPLGLSRAMADKVFLEAMEAQGKPFHVRWPMYLGVRLGGWTAFHKKKVSDKL
jgi:hypothetical protein